jgi:hypothetical protein
MANLPPRRKAILLLVLLGMLLGSFARVLRGVESDFPRHYEFARRFAAGEFIYNAGLDVPYPPFWALFWAPWTRLSPRGAQLAAFVVMGAGCLIALSGILLRIGRRVLPASDDRRLVALALALALTARFILRDLVESGPNLLIWSLVWGGVWFYLRGRRCAGGILVGIATALKMTPALFVPYFLLKREWRIAAAILATAALLTAAPGLFQAPPVFHQEMGMWGRNVWQGMTALDPSATILDAPSAANLSLRPALARFLQRYPAGHPLYLDHPGFLQFLDLSPRHAGMLVRTAMAALLLVVGWRFRRQASDATPPVVLPLELAAVSALCLLYSPITWNQHAVSLLPAAFLLLCCSIQWDRVTAWMWVATIYYVLFAGLLTRDVTGRPLALFFESYHVVTWAILLVVVLVLVWHRRMLMPAGEMCVGRPPGQTG